MGTPDVNAVLGKVGLPEPVADLAARDWDAIVVGGGHNGLTAAAYLAKAGQSVLVLEARERLGGACTLEQPFEEGGFLVSPCAYVVGLLDELVVRELELERHGYKVHIADPNVWYPFSDGTSYAGYLDSAKTIEHMRANGFSESEIKARAAYEDSFERARELLRNGPRDTWIGSSPTREEIEEILGGDEELIGLVFEDSIADAIDRYITDERLRTGLYGQGIIGAWGGPHTPGGAWVKLMHHLGDLLGQGSVWGYVDGGMGRISFAIAQSAMEAGAVIAAGVPVAKINPGEGVELESGDVIRAPIVLCNADPKRMLGMVGADAMPTDYRERIEAWKMRSPVVKVNAAMHKLPTFSAARDGFDPGKSMVGVAIPLEDAQKAFEAVERGEPSIAFCDLYFHTAYDPSVAPKGMHTMSVFAQYAPYELAEGTWDSRREEIGNLVLDAIAVHAPDVRECVAHMQVLGPPDIEEKVGLTGGQIFQGDVSPDQMWDRRLDHRTPVEGLYLCGAATHPAGSVIGLNGRSAAMAALEDANVSAPA